MSRRKAASDLARDLKAIRERKGVALSEVQDRTKIPLDTLERFEASLLIDNEHYNRVYIRALVRSYVATLGLDEEQTLDALDAAMEGEYNRELAVTYLGVKKPKPAAPSTLPPAKPTPAPEASVPPPPASDKAAAAPTPPAEEPKPASRKAQPKGAASSLKPKKTPPTRELGAVAELVEPPRFSTKWMAVAVTVVALALAVAGVMWILMRQGPVEPADLPDAPPVTADAEEATAAPPPTPVADPAQVGETIDVRIIAQPGPVREIRLTADDDLRRPYWLEVDSVKAVSVQNRLVIEQEWGQFRLEVEGYDYPTRPDVRDAQDRIVLTKPTVQAFLDSVSVR